MIKLLRVTPQMFHGAVVPVFSGMIWATGITVSTFNILPHTDNPTRAFLILAYSVYLIFIVESLLSLIDIAVQEGSWRFIKFPMPILAWLVAVPAVLVMLTGYLCAWENFMPLWVILVCMMLHKYIMSYYLSNPERYVYPFREAKVKNKLNG